MNLEEIQKLINDGINQLIDGLNSPNIWQILGTILSFVVSIIAIYLSIKNLKELKQTREADFKPIVIVKNANSEKKENRFHFKNNSKVITIIENIGRGPAMDIVIKIGERIVYDKRSFLTVSDRIEYNINYTIDPKVGDSHNTMIPLRIEYRDIEGKNYLTYTYIESQQDGWFNYSPSIRHEEVKK